MKPYIHAKLSVKKYGGHVQIIIHRDSNGKIITDVQEYNHD